KKMAEAGVKTIIYTDISRDGTLSGCNVEATAKLAEVSGINVVASGGVSNIEDIKALLPYADKGIEGVIVGKSIYTGSLDLQEAIRVAREA
ncbi:MAG: HisA/HisF-related TIM barrel protein, partial [Selenomonadaceae bacterium]|nr:HisA/HisF-related TIM barrel protein [Selenomonadaceae bacterium]